MSVRKRGGIVVIIAHRPAVLAATDQVLAINAGTVQGFGPRDEVLRKVSRIPLRFATDGEHSQPPQTPPHPPHPHEPGDPTAPPRGH